VHAGTARHSVISSGGYHLISSHLGAFSDYLRGVYLPLRRVDRQLPFSPHACGSAPPHCQAGHRSLDRTEGPINHESTTGPEQQRRNCVRDEPGRSPAPSTGERTKPRGAHKAVRTTFGLSDFGAGAPKKGGKRGTQAAPDSKQPPEPLRCDR